MWVALSWEGVATPTACFSGDLPSLDFIDSKSRPTRPPWSIFIFCSALLKALVKGHGRRRSSFVPVSLMCTHPAAGRRAPWSPSKAFWLVGEFSSGILIPNFLTWRRGGGPILMLHQDQGTAAVRWTDCGNPDDTHTHTHTQVRWHRCSNINNTKTTRLCLPALIFVPFGKIGCRLRTRPPTDRYKRSSGRKERTREKKRQPKKRNLIGKRFSHSDPTHMHASL